MSTCIWRSMLKRAQACLGNKLLPHCPLRLAQPHQQLSDAAQLSTAHDVIQNCSCCIDFCCACNNVMPCRKHAIRAEALMMLRRLLLYVYCIQHQPQEHHQTIPCLLCSYLNIHDGIKPYQRVHSRFSTAQPACVSASVPLACCPDHDLLCAGYIQRETTVHACCNQRLLLQQLLRGTLVLSAVLCNRMTKLGADNEAHST